MNDINTPVSFEDEIDDLKGEIESLQNEIKILKSNEKWLRTLTDQRIMGLVIATDNPLKLSFANAGLSYISGYSIQELYDLRGEDLLNIVHEDDRELFSTRYSARMVGDEAPKFYEFRIIKKDGSPWWVQIVAERIEYMDKPAVLGSFIDINDKKKIEQALRNNKEHYKLLFNQTPVSIFYYDKDLVINQCNDRFVSILQTSKVDLLGLDMKNIDDKSIVPCLEVAIRGREGIYEGPYSSTVSNVTLEISMKTEPVYNHKMEITGGVGIVEDMTLQKKVEAALMESEERFRKVVERSPIPMVLIDYNDNILYINNRFVEIFGYTIDDIPNFESWWPKAHPDVEYREKAKNSLMKGVRKAAKYGTDIAAREYKVTSKDGFVRDVEFSMAPVGEMGLITMNDITRHRKAEIELVKTKKIESIGVLAGGIAHDFNNILTSIIGNISLAKMSAKENQEVTSILDVAEKASWRAKDLTQQLLTFSKGGIPIKKVTSIHNLLEDTIDFVLSGSSIKCELIIEDEMWHAEIDEGQISQVIHNLVLNARQAMPDAGIITVSAKNYKHKKSEEFIKKGRYIILSIADQGKGIPEYILHNIFDPFFTTKEKGSGLGLSVTYSIVKKHEGHIEVHSKENEGTTFEVYLPASKEKGK